MADNKLHSMYTTEQELSGEFSPGVIKPVIYYNRPLVTGKPIVQCSYKYLIIIHFCSLIQIPHCLIY